MRLYLNDAASGPADFRSETMLLDGDDELVVPSGRASVAVADLNGDGRKDLLAGNTDGYLLFWANRGTDAAPVFDGSAALQADGVLVDLPGTPRSRPFVGDFDGDGVPDLLVGAADGLVRRYTRSDTSTMGEAPNINDGEPGGVYVYSFLLQNETVPPQIDAVVPGEIEASGVIRTQTLTIELAFSEELDAAAAASPGGYELRRAVNGVFGDGDDIVWNQTPGYVLTPSYSFDGVTGLSMATLDLGLGTTLPGDLYRLTVRSSGGEALRDPSGNLLDGNRDGSEGPDYVRTFVVASPGITVAPTSGLQTTESGGTATFTVVLDTQPAADVTLDLVSSDPTEGMIEPASLTFTPDDWNLPQSVTITGVDDRLDDGNIAYVIEVRPAASADPAYDGRDGADVSVTNTDDDTVTVAGRHIFYNQSMFDGYNAAANALDDYVIALDKEALLPGDTASFANYTSYFRGINGIMVDIAGLADPAAPRRRLPVLCRQQQRSRWLDRRAEPIARRGPPRRRQRRVRPDHARSGPTGQSPTNGCKSRSWPPITRALPRPTSSTSATPLANRAMRPATPSSMPPTRSWPAISPAAR